MSELILVMGPAWDDLSIMRKSAFAVLLAAAAITLACGPGAAGLVQFAGPSWNWSDNLAKASVLGRGMLPALLFGGSFAGLLLALIIGGCIGMARNAPPRPPKPKLSRKTGAASAAEKLQTV